RGHRGQHVLAWGQAHGLELERAIIRRYQRGRVAQDDGEVPGSRPGVQPQAAVARAIDRRRPSHDFGGTAVQRLYHDGLLRSVRTGDNVRKAEPPATWIE